MKNLLICLFFINNKLNLKCQIMDMDMMIMMNMMEWAMMMIRLSRKVSKKEYKVMRIYFYLKKWIYQEFQRIKK